MDLDGENNKNKAVIIRIEYFSNEWHLISYLLFIDMEIETLLILVALTFGITLIAIFSFCSNIKPYKNMFLSLLFCDVCFFYFKSISTCHGTLRVCWGTQLWAEGLVFEFFERKTMQVQLFWNKLCKSNSNQQFHVATWFWSVHGIFTL